VHSIKILSHEIIDLTEQKKFFNNKTQSKDRSNIQQTTYPRISKPTVPDANLLSHVFVAKSPFGGILVSGDSPQRAEKIWAVDLPRGIDKYILGHHGSRTSTSDYLLRQLPQLNFAISSARKKRYGHPHIEVIRKLHEQNVPLLQTEKWGSFSFYL
jgi:beta-lactamase superfamily II metal-dependent hydrolase